MRHSLFILFSFLWTYAPAQKIHDPCRQEVICPFHEILLKNNYLLHVGDTIHDQRTIRLTGPGIDTIIRTVKLKTPNTFLGWLQADFDDHFVLYYVSDQPISMRVIEKASGRVVASGPLVDFKVAEDVILFIDEQQQEKLGLLDLISMESKFYGPLDTPCQSWWWCIKYMETTGKQLSIDYRDWNGQTQRRIFDH